MSLIKIAAVAVLALFHVTCVKAGFVYNTEESGNESTKFVYRLDDSGKYLSNHLQYQFTYDAQGRTLTKQALYWNPNMLLWEPYYQMYYKYSNSNQGYTIEYACWDKRSESYSASMEKVAYVMDERNELICYQGFKWDKQAQEWDLVQNFGNLTLSGELYAQR